MVWAIQSPKNSYWGHGELLYQNVGLRLLRASFITHFSQDKLLATAITKPFKRQQCTQNVLNNDQKCQSPYVTIKNEVAKCRVAWTF